MMRQQAAFQRKLQLGDLLSQLLFGHICHSHRIRFSLGQSAQHGHRTDAQGVAGHGRQFDVALL